MSASSASAFGRESEERAAAYLEEMGWTIVARNWRAPGGEIDLVAKDGAEWVFVEVKARRSAGFGLPEEAVGRVKRGRLARTAEAFLAARGESDAPLRFDLLSIDPDGTVRHLPDAFR